MSKSLRMLAMLLAVFLAAPAWSQAYPDKPVKLLTAFPPGGGSDLLSRIVAKKLQEIWGQPVIVENRGGAQGSVGTAYALKSKPDGYTILVAAMGAIAINPHMSENVGYDVLKDIEAVSRGTVQPMILVANPNVPVKTLKDVETLAKSKPGVLTYATTGTQPQVMGEYFKLTSGIDLLHVRYNGAGPGVVAVLAGTTDLMISSPGAVVQHIKAGKLRAIAVLDKQRLDSIPDVPSALEAGYPQLSDLAEWYGFAVPVGTPEAIVTKINADFVTALNDPEVQKAIKGLGMNPSPSSREEYAKQIKVDFEKWGKLVKATGVKVE